MARTAKQSFLKTVGYNLPPGHRFLKVTEAFYWDRGHHTEIFGACVLDRSRKLDLSFRVYFPVVHDVFDTAWPIAPEFRAGSFTIAASAMDLDPATPILHAPLEPEEFDRAAADVAHVFDSLSWYFREYSNIMAVDKLLNDHPQQMSIHCPLAYRGAVGLIVAAMVGQRDLPALAAQHRAVLEKVDRGFYLPNFDRVARAVEQHPSLIAQVGSSA